MLDAKVERGELLPGISIPDDIGGVWDAILPIEAKKWSQALGLEVDVESGKVRVKLFDYGTAKALVDDWNSRN